jgi:RNA polymerase sigma factor (sigma-70 family)
VNEPDLDGLIRRSRDAFDAIAERFRPWMERVAARYAPDAGPDLVQAALLKAYTTLGRYDENLSFATWLFHILRNACFNHRRRPRPVPFPPQEEAGRGRTTTGHIQAAPARGSPRPAAGVRRVRRALEAGVAMRASWRT